MSSTIVSSIGKKERRARQESPAEKESQEVHRTISDGDTEQNEIRSDKKEGANNHTEEEEGNRTEEEGKGCESENLASKYTEDSNSHAAAESQKAAESQNPTESEGEDEEKAESNASDKIVSFDEVSCCVSSNYYVCRTSFYLMEFSI